MSWRSESGQSSLEAAILIPTFLLIMMLLLQPSILLYDKMVMQSAASQGLRLLATKPSSYGSSGFEELIESQLEAIPDVSIFHESDDGWDIELDGDETSQSVSIEISTEVKPLPIISLASDALGLTNDDGNFELDVKVDGKAQPDWVWDSGSSPQEWIERWQ